MEKYASMWRGDTPIDRQLAAADLWTDMTNYSVVTVDDPRSRLENMFPQSHTKEATFRNPEHMRMGLAAAGGGYLAGRAMQEKEASDAKKLQIGGALVGGSLLGAHQYYQSKGGKKATSRRHMKLEKEIASYERGVALGNKRSKTKERLFKLKKKYADAAAYSPVATGLAGAAVGATSGGLAARNYSKQTGML